MKPAELVRVAAGSTHSTSAGALLPKSSKKPSAVKGKSSTGATRITSIKTNKSEAARYRAADNPDFKVRTVRHGSKPAEYYIDVKHTTKERVEVTKRDPHYGLMIAKTHKLRKGEVSKIDLPFDNAKIESFVRAAEKDPAKIDVLKNPDEFFSFTVEGNRIPTTFRSAADLNNMLNYYLKTGSKGARISIFRVTGPNDWTQQKSKSALRRKRLKTHLRKTDKVAYTELTGKEKTRKRRYMERLKASGERYEKFKQKDKLRKRKWRKEHAPELKKARQQTSKRATQAQSRAANRAREAARKRDVTTLRRKYLKF